MKRTTRLISILLASLGLVASNAHADLIGAGIGGLIGSQFGSGDGKIAMAAIGAVVGDRMTQSAPVVVAGNYGYPAPVVYGYQSQPRIIVPNYPYNPPIVVRAPAPAYYPNYNYAYRQERYWHRGYGRDFDRGYGHMRGHHEGFERHH